MASCSKDITRQIKIGDIYMVFFDGDGSEQRGYRPGLVIQNNVGNKYSPNIIVLPITSIIKKRNQPTHVVVSADNSGLERDSVVLCENPRCLSKDKLNRYITTLPDKYMEEIAVAYILSTSIISFLPINAVHSVWQKASTLNSI